MQQVAAANRQPQPRWQTRIRRRERLVVLTWYFTPGLITELYRDFHPVGLRLVSGEAHRCVEPSPRVVDRGLA